MRFLKFMFIVFTLNSCMTYDYSYKSKEKINYIDYYKEPIVNKKYSFGTYISVIGIPIGSSVLLGNHTYNNAVKNGSPKDTASSDRLSIIGLGALAAGLGVFYLYNDTINQGKKLIISNNEIEQWYSHTIDYNENILLGSYNDGENTFVLSVNVKDTSKMYVENVSQLRIIKKSLTLNPLGLNFLKIISKNSLDKIEKDSYYYAFEVLGNIGSSYLEKAIENASNDIDIKVIIDGIKRYRPENPEYYYDLASNKYKSLYKNINYEKILNWLDIFNKISTLSIDETRKEFKLEKNKLEAESKRRNEILAKAKAEAEEVERKAQEEERKKIENEKQKYKFKAENIVNNILLKQKKFASKIKEGDCIGICDEFELNRSLIKNEPSKYSNSLFKKIVVAFETQSGLARNSNDYASNIEINKWFDCRYHFHSCLGQILKIDNKSNEVLIEIINGCKHFKSGEKIFMKKSKLIPC